MRSGSRRSRRGSAPMSLTEEKLQRIDRAIDETKRRLDRVALDLARPRLGGAPREDDAGARAQIRLRALYARRRILGLKALEGEGDVRRLRPGRRLSRADARRAGDFASSRASLSPIRAIASVREISTHSLRKALLDDRPGDRMGGRSRSAPADRRNQQIVDLTFPAMELYAMPAATQTLLDDAAVDIEQWIAEEVQTVFAEQEGAAFVSGNREPTSPKGFLAYTTVADASWSWGNIGYVATGVSGGFAASNPSDALFNLVYALRAGYRQNGKFVMNRQTQSTIRKFKTTTGEYLWAPPTSLDATGLAAEFPRRRGRGHAQYRRRQPLGRLRRFRARLSRRRSARRARAARSLFREALCAVLHDEARRRRRAGFRGDQAAEIRHGLNREAARAYARARPFVALADPAMHE